MTEHFDEDDVYKFDCEWVFLDTKKLSASTRPGAAIIIFAIHMRAKLLKIMIKINNPKAKERQLTEFPWESIKKITISKKEATHELSMILNKAKCNHSLCVIAATPSVFEKIYEVLNIVFFYLMNQRFKMNCAQICKNIRILSALEGPRADKTIISGTTELKCEGSLEDLIEGMLVSFEKRNRGTEKPEDSVLPGGTIRLDLDASTDKAAEDNMILLSKDDDKNSPNEDNVDSSEDNMNSPKEIVPEEIVIVEPEPNLGFDLHEILNVPSFVAIICTLFINLIYYLFFNQDM